ncbi:MAG: hypothetical protein GXY18_10350, partial [Methanomicrobiales archaeon]|nr:hypothetical protein [Methanomicrobiales archaeon]
NTPSAREPSSPRQKPGGSPDVIQQIPHTNVRTTISAIPLITVPPPYISAQLFRGIYIVT